MGQTSLSRSPWGSHDRVGDLRWGVAIVILLAALAACAAWYVVRLRGDARRASVGADSLAVDLARLTEEAQLEDLAGGQPALLRIEIGRAERRLDAGEFTSARTEETRLRVQIGAALREIEEVPRALARLEQAERAAVDDLTARRTIWDEHLIGTSAPDPDSIFRAREELARSWLGHGDELRALVIALSAVEHRMAEHTRAPRQGDPTARRLLLVGEILRALEDESGAQAYLREAIRNAPATDASLAFVRSDALAELAVMANDRGEHEEAIAMRREALDAVLPWAAERDPRVARLMYELASALHDRGPRTAEEARRTYARALEARLVSACGDSQALATHLNNYGLLLKQMGRLQEAEPLLVSALEMRQRLVSRDDRGTATMMNNVGTVMHALGGLEQAEDTLSSALAMRYRLFPLGHRDVAQSLQNLAWLRQKNEEYAEAAELDRSAVAILREIACGDDLDLAIAIDNLGSALSDLRKYAEAERLTREALAMEQRLIAGDHATLAQTLDNLGVILYRRKQLAEAERHLTAALEMRRALYGGAHSTMAVTLKHLAWLHERAKDFPRAERLYLEAIEVLRSSPFDPGELCELQHDLADCVYAAGDPGRAMDFFREALATAKAHLPRCAKALAHAAEGLAIAAQKSLRHADGEDALVAAAEAVLQVDAFPPLERERVVEALCVLYSLWPKESEHAQRARKEAEAWRARLHAVEVR